jgi:twitching motility protein PilT
MTRRRRRREDDEEVDAEGKEGEAEPEAADGEALGSDDSEKLLKKIGDLERKLDDLVGKMGLVLIDARDADEKVKKLVENFKSLDKEMEELGTDVDEKLEKLSETEKKLEAIVQESEERGARIASLEEAKESIRAEVDNQVATVVQQIEAVVSALKEEFENVTEKIGALGAQVEELREGGGGAAPADIEPRLDKISQESKESVAQLREQLESHRAELAPLIEKIGEQSLGEAREVAERVKALEEKLALFTEKVNIDELMTRLDSLSTGSQTDEIAAALNEIVEGRKEHNERIEALETHLNDITEELNQIDDRYDEAEKKHEELLGKVQEDILSKVQEDILGKAQEDILGKVQEELKKTLEEYESGNKESQEQIKLVLGESQGIPKRLEESREILTDLEQQIAQVSEKYGDLAGKFTDAVSKSELNMEKVNVAFRLVEEVESKISKVVSPVDDLIARIEDFENLPEVGDLGFELNDLLQVMIKHGASDLHIKDGSPPTVRLDGDLVPVGNQVLNDKECKFLILQAMSKTQRRKLLEKRELDFAYAIPEARFRVNAFLQRSTVSASFRMLRTIIPTFEEMNLPPFLKKFASIHNGLVLVTGPAGCGKSTTLAALIDHINETKKMHIVTIEDPIEFVHKDKLSLVTQREVGADTPSFGDALKSSLRQDPNVILIGEMRDPETIMTATIAAETGHLVLSTLHTPNTIQAIERIMDVFAGEQQKQFRLLLSTTLRGVISQRLLNRVDGEGRVPAVEILVVTPTVASLILERKTHDIYPLMVQGGTEGMQTFTAALTKLYEAGLISKEDAIYQSDHPTEFRLGVEGHTSTGAAVPDDSLMSWL